MNHIIIKKYGIGDYMCPEILLKGQTNLEQKPLLDYEGNMPSNTSLIADTKEVILY